MVEYEELEIEVCSGYVEEERYGFWGGHPQEWVYRKITISYNYDLSWDEIDEATKYLKAKHEELKNVNDDEIVLEDYNEELKELFRERAITQAEYDNKDYFEKKYKEAEYD